jgi:hypothetical protein
MTVDSPTRTRATGRSWSASAVAEALWSYPRRNPLALGYLLLIGAGLFVFERLLSGPTADRLKIAISTNPHNLGHHPVFVLLASPLVSATDSGWLSHALVIGFGVGVCLAALERRIGAWRAVAVILLGNTVATAIASGVAALAIQAGRYPAQWWNGYDYGISYGVLAVVAAATVLLSGRWRVAGSVLVLAYPFSSVQWFGLLPNFTTIGHVTAALFGLAAGQIMISRLPERGRRRR